MIIVADGIDTDSPAVQQSVTEGLASIAQLDGVISVVDPWSSGIDELTATDGRAALVVITLSGDLDEEEQVAVAGNVEDLAHEVDAGEILVGGDVLVGETFATASAADLLRGEAIALPITFVVMVVLLGGLVAAGIVLADQFPARGADPVTVIASTSPDDPALVAWLDTLASDAHVVGHSVREGMRKPGAELKPPTVGVRPCRSGRARGLRGCGRASRRRGPRRTRRGRCRC